MDIMKSSDWWESFGRSKKEMRKSAIADCEWELEVLGMSLNPVLKEGEKLFPALRSIAIASLYGKEDDLWRRYSNRPPPPGASPPDVQFVGHKFNIFLNNSNITDICIRDSSGPLGRPPTVYLPQTPTSNTKPRRTIHFCPVSGINDLNLPFGRTLRWIADPTTSIRDPSDDTEPVYDFLDTVMEARAKGDTPEGLQADQTQPADLVIYCDTPWRSLDKEKWTTEAQLDDARTEEMKDDFKPNGTKMTSKEQKESTEQLGDDIQAMFRMSSGLLDRIRWYPIVEAPICSACRPVYLA